MASVQFNFVSEGENEQLNFDHVLIEVLIPTFSYSINRNEIFRYVKSYESFSASQSVNDNGYLVELPINQLSGKSTEDIYGFFLYHFIDILKDDGVNINDYSFKFNISIKDDLNQVISKKEFEGIYYLKSSFSSDYDNKIYQVEYEKYINTYGDINSKKNAINTEGISNLPFQNNNRIFIINKAAYELFKYVFDVGHQDRIITDKFVLDFIQILVDLNGEYPQLLSQDFTIGYTQLADFFKRTEYTISEEFFDYLKTNFNKLFDFPLSIPELEIINIKGKLEIITNEELSQQALDFYDLFIEYLQVDGGV